MKDYASKDWLRPTATMLRNLALFLWDVMIVAGLAFAAAWIIGANEARAQGNVLLLLETSMLPATMDECRRARPDLWRPTRVISKQNGTGTPWHHRTCYWQVNT